MKKMSLVALLGISAVLLLLLETNAPTVSVTDTSTNTIVKELELTTVEKLADRLNIPKPKDQNERNRTVVVDKKTGLPHGQFKVPAEQEKVYRALGTETYSDWEQVVVNQEYAHQVATGEGVIVAVIDTGFALNHEDLASAWHTNAGEMGTTQDGDYCWTGVSEDKQTNNCDDDQNGYADDWKGWDFTDQVDGPDNDVSPGELDPNNSAADHGTIVASVLGSRKNSLGSVGTSPDAMIMPLQVLDDAGLGTTSAIESAIRYAADNGANVINLSLGGAGDDPYVAAAIDYATSLGVTIVAASGNSADCETNSNKSCEGLVAPGYMNYPAANENVIAVGAVNSEDVRANFSSYGPELDFVAPGANIGMYASWSNDNHTSLYATNLYGTSFAAPFISGQVANLLSIDSSLNHNKFVELLKFGSDTVAASDNNGFSQEYGYGRMDLEFSLVPLVPSVAATSSSTSPNSDNLFETICNTSPGKVCKITVTDSIAGTESHEIKSNENGLAKYSFDKGAFIPPVQIVAEVGGRVSSSYQLSW